MNPCNPSRPTTSRTSRPRVRSERVAEIRRANQLELGVRFQFTRNGRAVGKSEGLTVIGTDREACAAYPGLLRHIADVLRRTADGLEVEHPELCGPMRQNKGVRMAAVTG